MKNSVSFLLVAPDAVRRGWVGWILAGAVARTGLDLAWAGIFDASSVAADLGAKGSSGPWGVLVFRGEDADAKLAAAVGDGDGLGSLAGMLGAGVVVAPAAGADVAALLDKLASAQAAGEAALSRPEPDGTERSLVLVKPDNFQFPGIRPGAIMDVLARTGLNLVAMKVHRMSVAQGMEFYGPVLDVLAEKFGAQPGREHWEKIVEFMSGSKPSGVSASGASRRSATWSTLGTVTAFFVGLSSR